MKGKGMLKFIAAMAACALVVGCATQEAASTTQKQSEKANTAVNAIQIGVQERAQAEVPLYSRVRGLWVSERSVQRASTDALPAMYDRQFVYRSTLPVTVSDFAAVIQQNAKGNVSLIGEPQQGPGVLVDHQGSLRQFVNGTSQRLGVDLQFNDGKLEVVQTEARTFPLQRVTVELGSQASSGTKRDPAAEIEQTLKVIAPKARIVLSRANKSVTVVDRPSVMRDVEKYLAYDSAEAGKTVLVRWQLISFAQDSNGQVGIGLNYFKNKAGKGLAITSGSAPDVQADTLKFSITDPLRADTGSSLVLGLLNEAGRATVIRDGIMPILNNDVYEFERTQEKAFTAKTSLASIPSLNTTTNVNTVLPVIEFASKEVGLQVKMGASIHPSEEVDLNVDFKLTVLDDFKKVVTSVVTQEFPETSKTGAKARLRGRHGDTFLLAMDNNDESLFDRRTGLGYQENGKSKREHWFLLLTPVISRGSL